MIMANQPLAVYPVGINEDGWVNLEVGVRCSRYIGGVNGCFDSYCCPSPSSGPAHQ